jgi:hypothetical protein
MSRVDVVAAYQVATNEPSAIKMPHVLSFATPQDEDMWVCSKDDWRHLKSRVAELGEEKGASWLQGIGYVLLGGSLSGGLSIPAFLNATEGQRPWVIPTVAACTGALFFAALAFLVCGWISNKATHGKGCKIAEDMDGIYARYQQKPGSDASE